MGGAVPLFHLYAFRTWTGTTLRYTFKRPLQSQLATHAKQGDERHLILERLVPLCLYLSFWILSKYQIKIGL